MRLTITGNGTAKKQAEALTDEDEELLWSKEDQFLQCSGITINNYYY